MAQELKPEDLIVTAADGSTHVNHGLLEAYGLFNLPVPLMRRALTVYHENAKRQGQEAARDVEAFIALIQAIRRFPRPMGIHFTRGAAYLRNLEMLERYSK
jgi:hypothetical protein